MEYRIAKGWRVFAVIFAGLFVAGGVALMLKPFFDPDGKLEGLFIFLGASLVVLGILAGLDTVRTKITIDDYSINLQKAFSLRSVLLHQIKGYRKGEKGLLYIVPVEGAGKPLQLSAYLERKDELMAWLVARYPDLDAVAYEEETKTILSNEQFGVTDDERKDNLDRAKKITGVANAIATGVLLWTFIYPKPYELAMTILLLLPWVGVYIAWYFKGLVRFDSRKKSAYPSVSILILLPACGLLVRCLMDYSLYAPGTIWMPVISGAVLLTLLCLLICKKAIAEEKNKGVTIAVMALMAGLYSFGLIVFTDCHYDKSKPETFKVLITGKHINSGKSTTYHLTLAPWGRFDKEDDVTVSRDLYDDVQEGKEVHVHLHEGKWHIPWYFIME